MSEKENIFGSELIVEAKKSEVLAKLSAIVANVRQGCVHGPLQATRDFEALMKSLDEYNEALGKHKRMLAALDGERKKGEGKKEKAQE